MIKSKLVVCDICDTLYRSNTTFDFLDFVASKNVAKKFWLNLIRSKFSPFFYVLTTATVVFKTDFGRVMALRLLAGRSSVEIYTLAKEFYENFLVQRSNAKIFAVLKKEQEHGVVILVSSSIDPVVEVIAEKNRMDFICSTLEVKKGIITGRIHRDLTGRKHLVVKDKMEKERLNDLLVITDNRSDWELVKMAGQRIVVVQSENQKTYWNDLHPDFISV